GNRSERRRIRGVVPRERIHPETAAPRERARRARVNVVGGCAVLERAFRQEAFTERTGRQAVAKMSGDHLMPVEREKGERSEIEQRGHGEPPRDEPRGPASS